MKAPKKVISIITSILVASSMCVNIASADVKNTTSESLVGTGRYETAIKISQNGWSAGSTKEAVIVNDSAIADALSATPFAKAKNAPILLTGSKSLDYRTKAELKRLNVNKVYLIGGKAVLSDNVESQLKSEGISVDRISGSDRYYTSLELAKRLDSNKKISQIAVVNGAKGLADAVSVGAPAAQNNIPIILSDPGKGTQVADSFISSKSIKTSYVIGGESAVSNSVSSKLKNVKRLGGSDRNETNAKVMDEFYKKIDLNAVYITKDGSKGENQLIDALSVGVLAAKKESPVMLVRNELANSQKELMNKKNLSKVVQVGGQGNETAFEAVKSDQKKYTYTVNNIKDLKSTIAKANANDVVTIKDDIDDDITIDSKYAISVVIEGDCDNDKVTINMPNGDVTNKGDLDEVVIDDIAFGTFINEEKIDTLTIKDENGGKIVNERNGEIKTLNVTSRAKNVWIENNGEIKTLDNKGEDTVLDGDEDDIDKVTGDDLLEPGDVDKDEYTGSGGGSSSSKDDDDDDDDVRNLVDSVKVEDQNTIVVEFEKRTTGVEFYWDGEKSKDEIDDSDITVSRDKETYTIHLDDAMEYNKTYDLIIKKSGYKKYTKSVKYNKDLKGYLEDKSTGEYKLSKDYTINSFRLTEEKVINLNGYKVTLKDDLNVGSHKIIVKGSGTIKFEGTVTMVGSGNSGVVIQNDGGSSIKFEGTIPSGYYWDGNKVKRLETSSIGSISVNSTGDTVTVNTGNTLGKIIDKNDFAVSVGGTNVTDFTVTKKSDTQYEITLATAADNNQAISVTGKDDLSGSKSVTFSVIAFKPFTIEPKNGDNPPYQLMKINYERNQMVDESWITITMKTPASKDKTANTVIWKDSGKALNVNKNAFWQWSYRDASSIFNNDGTLVGVTDLTSVERSDDKLLVAGSVVEIKLEVKIGGNTHTITKNYTIKSEDVKNATYSNTSDSK